MATSSNKGVGRFQRNLIQIAGIKDAQEAAMLARLGVRYLGFPLRLPIHKEDLSEAEAASIIRSLPAKCHAVLITYLDDAHEIAEFCQQMGSGIVQLHGAVGTDQLQTLRCHAQNLRIIKSLVIRQDNLAELVDLVCETTSFVDAFITDTFDPSTGAAGATGKTHDWTISKKLVELSGRPVILAGGLNPQNVREAILQVQPAGVDAHTGVEGPDGRKSRDLVSGFIAEAHEGFRNLSRGW